MKYLCPKTLLAVFPRTPDPMKILRLVFFISFLATISCKEKENPSTQIGTVRIEGIELEKLKLPGARTLANFRWNHTFPNSLEVNFLEVASGKSFPISINPNDFGQAYQIELPLGSYEYTGQSTGATVSPILPIRLQGKFDVTKSTESLVLKASSDHGLITYSKSNLSGAPKVKAPSEGVFFSNPDFYYAYVKGGELVKTELALSNGKAFRIGLATPGFSHRQFQVRTNESGTPVTFTPVDFEVSTDLLSLGPNGYPSGLLPYSILDLPASQNETSGLQWIQGRLFSISDGGNPAEIYEINPQTGILLRTIKVSNVPNVDWEDLAASPTHLYVGDFGNNSGNRKDLKVLKIPIAAVLNQTDVSAEIISFSYPDQSDFSGSNPNHNFDCEALVFSGNRLHLFSKNRGDQQTKHYSLSPDAGNQVAVLSGRFDSKGLITGADASGDGQNMVLLGYEDRGISSRSFIWTFAKVSGPVFSSTGNQFFLGSPVGLGQTEGVTIDQMMEIKISGERISQSGLTIPPKLFGVDLGGIFTP